MLEAIGWLLAVTAVGWLPYAVGFIVWLVTEVPHNLLYKLDQRRLKAK